MKYSYEEYKIVKIHVDDDNLSKRQRTLNLKVPVDFEVTKEWIEEKVSDYPTSKCEEWLLQKGFKKDEYGRWGIYESVPFDQEPKKDIKLPGFFFNKGRGDLYVSFGTIIGIRNFSLPAASSKDGHIGMPLKHYHDLPLNVDRKTQIRLRLMETPDNVGFRFYAHYVGFTTFERDANPECTGIHNSKNFNLLLLKYILEREPDQYETHEFPEGFIDSLSEEDWNWVRSTKSVVKYAL